MANPNKYNDPSSGGNIYGDIPESPNVTGNNGRTPVNPAAQNPMSFKIETHKANASVTMKDPITQA
jgi:hypothetical protein